MGDEDGVCIYVFNLGDDIAPIAAHHYKQRHILSGVECASNFRDVFDVLEYPLVYNERTALDKAQSVGDLIACRLGVGIYANLLRLVRNDIGLVLKFPPKSHYVGPVFLAGGHRNAFAGNMGRERPRYPSIIHQLEDGHNHPLVS